MNADSIAQADASAVQDWADSGDASKPYGQNTSGNQPTYRTAVVNGKPVVRFATDDSLVPDPTARTLTAANTLFIVATPATSGSGYLLSGSQVGGCPAIISGYNPGSGVKAFEYFHGNGAERLTFAASTSGFHVLLIRRTDDTGNVKGYFDGTLVFDQAVIATDWVGATLNRIGSINGGASDFFNGDIRHILHYDTALSLTDINNVGQYLADDIGGSWTTVT